MKPRRSLRHRLTGGTCTRYRCCFFYGVYNRETEPPATTAPFFEVRKIVRPVCQGCRDLGNTPFSLTHPSHLCTEQLPAWTGHKWGNTFTQQYFNPMDHMDGILSNPHHPCVANSCKSLPHEEMKDLKEVRPGGLQPGLLEGCWRALEKHVSTEFRIPRRGALRHRHPPTEPEEKGEDRDCRSQEGPTCWCFMRRFVVL